MTKPIPKKIAKLVLAEGDTTAAYIAAFGVGDLINNIKKACAAGAIVAGTNDEPTIEKIEEIAKLVEVNPR